MISASTLRDTPYASLMSRRVYNVLLVATHYDAFMLEEDGRVEQQIYDEYAELHLSTPPRFTLATHAGEALALLEERHFELVILMPCGVESDIFTAAGQIKRRHPETVTVVLTPFSREVSRRIGGEDLTHIDYVFSWLGEADLLLAIIKLVEDRLNAPHDLGEVGVQAILLVDDSIRAYSAALPHIYRTVLEQSREHAREALNDHLKTLRMRGRPKVLLARSYEEAAALVAEYPHNLLGLVTDMSFDRAGRKDSLAGYALARHIREVAPLTPLIIQSSEAANEEYARRLGAAFLCKGSRRYARQLADAVIDRFGFGPLVLDDPVTGEASLRVEGLADLEEGIFRVPDKTLAHHLALGHFSRFLYARSMFDPAEILRAHDPATYADMDEARLFIHSLIARYRKTLGEGVVAVFRSGGIDRYSHFARIGSGSLGGKGRGLAFIGSFLGRYPELQSPTLSVALPRTVVVCTDLFDEYMSRSALYPIALSERSDEEILRAFLAAPLPPPLVADLEQLVQTMRGPLAVRSSSLLEDAHYQPFAGVYATYMVAPRPTARETLRELERALKGVYASVFYRDSKSYLRATQSLIEEEKMAVVIQETIGTRHGSRFHPTLSAVARSLNFYPIGAERTEEGIVQCAVGLGKQIVDGGTALRFSPTHPRHILQLASPRTALRETQRSYYAIDLEAGAPAEGAERSERPFTADEDHNLVSLPVTAYPADDAAAPLILSSYDMDNDMLTPGIDPRSRRRIATFHALLEGSRYPFAPTISRLLQIGTAEMGRPVELELAANLTRDKLNLYLLQIRPIVDPLEDVGTPEAAADRPDARAGRIILESSDLLGNGVIADVRSVLYVRTRHYKPSLNTELAEEVGRLNELLQREGEGYVLVGPGRWGSSDPALGIPVRWGQIAGARLIAECALDHYRVEPSQGTHFFQNLTSLRVGYFTIAPHTGAGRFDEAFLESLPARYEHEHLRLVTFDRPLRIRMDGRHGHGLVSYSE